MPYRPCKDDKTILQEQAFPATLLTVAEKNDKMMITNGVSSLRS
jgi:hypothetical protein